MGLILSIAFIALVAINVPIAFSMGLASNPRSPNERKYPPCHCAAKDLYRLRLLPPFGRPFIHSCRDIDGYRGDFDETCQSSPRLGRPF